MGVLRIFQDIGTFSHVISKRSQRELSIDVAEHRLISKNYQDTHYRRFSVTPNTGIAFPKTGLCLYCDSEAQDLYRLERLPAARQHF